MAPMNPLPLKQALTVLVLCTTLLIGCAPEPVVHRVQGQVFGTAIEVHIYGESAERAQTLGAQVMDEFNRLHHKYHAWRPSALTDLNDHIARGERYQGDEEMVYLLQSAAVLAEQSAHTFNPAIGRLVRLWGFHGDRAVAQQPPAEEIRRLVEANPRMSDLRYDGTVIWSVNETVMLDFGGWVKGYALDRAAGLLRAAGVRAALINVGGNILAIGQPGERPWQVGIQNPRGAGTVARIALHDNEAIGTSGDYQRYFSESGKRRAHIIDPRTGEPVDLVASVTVIVSGGDAPGLRSDGASKPMFIVGPDQWRDMAQRLGLDQVMLIDAQGVVHMTTAMEARLSGSTAQ